MDRVSSTGLTSANEGNDPVVTARADGERSVSRIRRAILTIRASPPLRLDLPFFTICLRLRAGGNDSIYAASRRKPVNRRGVNREVFKLLINSGNCVERWNVVSYRLPVL